MAIHAAKIATPGSAVDQTASEMVSKSQSCILPAAEIELIRIRVVVLALR